MEWDPADYARHSDAQLVWARELIARLHLAGDQTILDVGCGDGKVSAEFARAMQRGGPPHGFVLGVDSSPAFIEYARRHYPPGEYPNLRFAVMDARRLDDPHSFDLIFSNAVLHWVDDHPAFLSGCARLLRPGGRLVTSCGGAGNARQMVAVLDELIHAARWGEHFTGFEFPYYFYSPAEYERWLPQAGFRPLRLALVEKDMAHAGQAGLTSWIRTTWLPYTQRLPVERRPAFIEQAAAAYLERHPPDAAGLCHVQMVRLEVEAERFAA